jgi:hypothetical protein
MELTEELFRIINNGADIEPAPSVIDNGVALIENPSIRMYHKFNCWPKLVQVIPEEEEGYRIIDEGYKLRGEGEDRYIARDIRKLLIVDEPPELEEGQIIENDHWEEQGDKWIHVYPVWTVVDPGEPEIDENHILHGDEWVYDQEQRTKTHVYHVLTKVDREPPEIDDDQEIIGDHWEVRGDEYVHIYEVRTIIDHPPVLEEGQQVLDFHWEDDGTYKTKVYDRIRFVVDNPPVLEEGQQIIERREEDDGVTVTYIYEVRYVVDNPPTLEEGQEIIEDHWDDDGVTRTHVYEVRFIVDNPPEIGENQELYEDHWDDDGTTRTHVYTVLTVIDEVPEVGENQELEDRDWDIDLENKTKTHLYKVWTIIDETKDIVVGPNQELELLEWDINEEAGTKTQLYKLWEIVDNGPNPPTGHLYNGRSERVKDWETGTITVAYIYDPYPAIRVSKLALEYTLGTMGKLETFEAFLNSLPDIDFGNGETKSVKHFYDTANELNTNNQLCVPYIEAAARALELSVNQVFDILQRCAVQPQQA